MIYEGSLISLNSLIINPKIPSFKNNVLLIKILSANGRYSYNQIEFIVDLYANSNLSTSDQPSKILIFLT